MDTREDVELYSIEKEIRSERAPKPCDFYMATSRAIDACANCGWEHYMAYYELAPELTAESGHKYLSVDSRTGKTAHLDELPEGADLIGPTEGNA